MSNGRGDHQKCSCGFKRRGTNHDEGKHHKEGKHKTKK